ncbi:MAG: hypothetical protein MUE54_06070 [Anaerolineae bacterium]|jgi:hypothetical protein|nr:hypothetical protein [Anaerolineae bacterium]
MPIIGIILGLACLTSGIGFWTNIPNQLDIGTIFSFRFETLIRPAIDSGQINLIVLGISSIILILSSAVLLALTSQWLAKKIPFSLFTLLMIAMVVGMLVGLIGGGIIGGGVAGIGGSLIGMLGGGVGVGTTIIIVFRVEKYVTTHPETYLPRFQTICLSAFGAILAGGVLVIVF